MYLIRLILCVAAALMLASASPAPDADPISTLSSLTSSAPNPTETPIVITEMGMCTNKTYIYCSHRDLTGDYTKDIGDAARGFTYYCPRHQIDPYRYYRTMSGRSQVYVCNYGDSLLPCTSDEYWAANALLDDKCGKGGGGYMYRKNEDRTWSVGRDPTLNDHEFASECRMW